MPYVEIFIKRKVNSGIQMLSYDSCRKWISEVNVIKDNVLFSLYSNINCAFQG